MPVENTITLIAAVLAFIAAAADIGVTLYTTRFRRFTGERWWERKALAYTTALEALYQMRTYFDEQLWVRTKGEDAVLPRERVDELFGRYRKGRGDVERAVAIGEFVMCSQAVESLRSALQPDVIDVMREHTIEGYRAHFKTINECIGHVQEYGKKDLVVQ